MKRTEDDVMYQEMELTLSLIVYGIVDICFFPTKWLILGIFKWIAYVSMHIYIDLGSSSFVSRFITKWPPLFIDMLVVLDAPVYVRSH